MLGSVDGARLQSPHHHHHHQRRHPHHPAASHVATTTHRNLSPLECSISRR
jgi:hypothetical protein